MLYEFLSACTRKEIELFYLSESSRYIYKTKSLAYARLHITSSIILQMPIKNRTKEMRNEAQGKCANLKLSFVNKTTVQALGLLVSFS